MRTKTLCFKGNCAPYMFFKKCVFIISLSMISISCAPVVRDYYKPIYSEGVTYSSGCGGSGPANKISIQLSEGVELEVSSSSSAKNERFKNFHFSASIIAPSGTYFQFESDEIVISDNTTNKTWSVKIVELITRAENIPNANSDESAKNGGYFSVIPTSKITGNTFFGYNTLFGKKYFNSGASISIFSSDIEYKLEDYSVQLPSIIINGKKYTIEPIRFLHVRSIGIDPLNC
ncbi:hypothetical protein HT094_15495 [Shewanella sp. ZOR0012]|uniref:hypothetical protein n=1 Tax=Shewanella sp. ZOR0012 TaxID=1339231 RepID=UPI0006462654|nr:hypothetical protein [Shewanella sp. ZOR0012]NSM25588.1 hypothetical protein [Shewanella sp. ZOR0012]